MQMRPVTDLQNNFAEIEALVLGGNSVCLTQNGRGRMVVMSMDTYETSFAPIEAALDEADHEAAMTRERLSHEQVFGGIRKLIRESHGV